MALILTRDGFRVARSCISLRSVRKHFAWRSIDTKHSGRFALYQLSDSTNLIIPQFKSRYLYRLIA